MAPQNKTLQQQLDETIARIQGKPPVEERGRVPAPFRASQIPADIRDATLSGLESIGQAGFGAIGAIAQDPLLQPPQDAPIPTPSLRPSTRVQDLAREISQQAASDIAAREARAQAEGRESTLLREFGQSAVASLPPLAALPAGLPAVATLAGTQQFGSAFTQQRDARIAQGKTPEQAEREATAPAILSGLITGTITQLGGNTGLEGLRGFVTSGGAKQVAGQILRNVKGEFAEEAADELFQTALEILTINPEIGAQEALTRAGQAGTFGALLSGPVTTAQAIQQQRGRAQDDQRGRTEIAEAGRLIPRASESSEQRLARQLPQDISTGGRDRRLKQQVREPGALDRPADRPATGPEPTTPRPTGAPAEVDPIATDTPNADLVTILDSNIRELEGTLGDLPPIEPGADITAPTIADPGTTITGVLIEGQANTALAAAIDNAISQPGDVQQVRPIEPPATELPISNLPIPADVEEASQPTQIDQELAEEVPVEPSLQADPISQARSTDPQSLVEVEPPQQNFSSTDPTPIQPVTETEAIVGPTRADVGPPLTPIPPVAESAQPEIRQRIIPRLLRDEQVSESRVANFFARTPGAQWLSRIIDPRAAFTPEERKFAEHAANQETGRNNAAAVASLFKNANQAFQVDPNTQLVTNITPIKEGTSLALSDIFENPENYRLTSEQTKFILLFQNIQADARADIAQAAKNTGKSTAQIRRALKFENSDINILPRVVLSIRGKEFSKATGTKRAIGALQAQEKARRFTTQAEGIQKGAVYLQDLPSIMDVYLNRVYKIMADIRLVGEIDFETTGQRRERFGKGLARENSKLRARIRSNTRKAERLEAIIAEPSIDPKRRIALDRQLANANQRVIEATGELELITPKLERARQLAKTPAPDEAFGFAVGPAFNETIVRQEVAEAARLFNEFPSSKTLRIVTDVNQILKAFKASFDVSFAFLQLQIALAKKPKVGAKAILAGFKGLASPGAAARIAQNDWETVRDMLEHGVPFGDTPEVLRLAAADSPITKGLKKVGTVLEAVPVLRTGKNVGEFAFRRSQSAFRDAIDTGLYLSWKAHQPLLTSEAAKRDFAIFNRNMFGVGRNAGLGLTVRQQLAQNIIFFAPAFNRATVNLVADTSRKGLRGNLARSSMTNLVLGGMVFIYGAGKALGLSDDELADRLNPLSSRFLSLPVNGTEIGIGGAVRSYIKLIGTIARSAKRDPEAFLTANPERNPISRFLRGKGSSVVGIAADAAFGRDFLGEETNFVRIAGEQILPFSLGEVVSGIGRGEDFSTIATTTGGTMLGLNARFMSEGEKLRVARDQAALNRYSMRWQELGAVDQALLVNEFPALRTTGQPITPVFREFLSRERNRRKARINKRVRLPEGLELPGFDSVVSVGGFRHLMVDDDAALFEQNLIKELNRVLPRVVNSARFRSVTKTQQQEAINKVFRGVRQKVAGQLVLEQRRR